MNVSQPAEQTPTSWAHAQSHEAQAGSKRSADIPVRENGTDNALREILQKIGV